MSCFYPKSDLTYQCLLQSTYQSGLPYVWLLTHFLPQSFGLSDPATEESLNDTPQYCEFASHDPGDTRLPDESTILWFCQLIEANNLSLHFMAALNATLSKRGLLLKPGTVIDATSIAAPSSTKNSSGERDPEMQQTKKCNQWHFGMKAYIGVNAESGLVHSAIGTAANVHDDAQASDLLHGGEWITFVMPDIRASRSALWQPM